MAFLYFLSKIVFLVDQLCIKCILHVIVSHMKFTHRMNMVCFLVLLKATSIMRMLSADVMGADV